MLPGQSLISLLSLFFSSAQAMYGFGLIRCQYTSAHDLVYLEQIYYNKMLLVQYNSTLGKYVGYTEKTKEIADDLNKNQKRLDQEKRNFEKCRTNVELIFNLLYNPVEPTVKLKSVDLHDSRHEKILICSAYNFYPKSINVTWLKNGKRVTTDVTSTEELFNGDWHYQIHSFLEFTPEPDENIACMVEHASLTESKLYHWEPMADVAWKKITIGITVLLFGLFCILAGFMFYKRHTFGPVAVPTHDP